MINRNIEQQKLLTFLWGCKYDHFEDLFGFTDKVAHTLILCNNLAAVGWAMKTPTPSPEGSPPRTPTL
jgi:hypothetical protein